MVKYLVKSLLLLCLILTVFSSSLSSASYTRGPDLKFEHLTVQDGLSYNTVFCILQDDSGFMWFGTQDGLNRFNGYTFVHYRFDPLDLYSLSSNTILSLFQDQEGVLWVGTDKGLNKYDRQKNRFLRYQNIPTNSASLSNNIVNVIFEDWEGELWIGTEGGGLNRFDRQEERFIQYRHQEDNPNSLSSKRVRTIFQDKKGVLWFGTAKGLNRFDRNKEQFIHYKYRPQDPENWSDYDDIKTIYEDSKGNLWVGTLEGLNLFDRQEGRFSRYHHLRGEPNSLSANFVLSICEDQLGTLWVGTIDGLNRLDTENTEEGDFIFTHYYNRPYDPGSLSSSGIRTMYQDGQGILWIGTWGGGVNILDLERKKFKHYRSNPDDPTSLSNNLIFSIFEDSSGVLWIGTWEGGLNRKAPNSHTFTHYKANPRQPGSLSDDRVRAITEGEKGKLWVGTWGGLNLFDPQKEIFTHYKHNPNQPNSLSDDTIITLHKDRTGFLWIGTISGGLNKFDPQREIFTHYKQNPNQSDSLSDNHVNVIIENQSNTLWLGTETGGINHFDPQTGTFKVYKNDPNNANTLNNNCIKTLYQDRKGVLWIGTLGGGLNKFEPDRQQWTAYTKENGLPDNVIYSILEDSRGNFWLSSEKGISRFDPQEGTVKNYDANDGLQGDEFNAGAFYKSPRTGEIFLGGLHGFNSFYPGMIKDNTHIPPVVITAFKVFNKPVAFDTDISEVKEIRLPQEDSFFSFEFAALNYRQSGENQYQYKLEGFDQDWIKADKRRYAGYTNLSGGTYVFRVIGSNNDDIWNEEGASVTIVIVPPFYKTTWFKVVVVVFIFFSIYMIYWLRMRSVQAQRIKLERLVNERTAELRQRQVELEEAKDIAEQQRRVAEFANRSKSEFLARISHEIRTPMNAIIGFTDLMMDTPLNEEQIDYAKTINTSSQSLLTLINDILDASRIEAGQFHLESQDFDPEITAFGVCEMIRPRLGSKPVEILCHIDDKVPSYVIGDPGRYRQVLLNFMGNAAKFTETGEIVLSIKVDQELADFIKLHAAIADTGIGIPGDKLETIFEAFQQVDGSYTSKFSGSGLGLTICKQIAHRMKGEVWVESELGRGSTFHFTALLKKSPKKPPLQKIPTSLTGKNILVVDDNKHNLELLSRYLTSASMRVTLLTHGEEVLPTIQKSVQDNDPFDLCILDIQMPGLSGYDVADQIRGPGSPMPDLPLLGFSSIVIRQPKSMKEYGFDAFLPKPINRQRLLEMIAQLLTKDKIPTEERKKEPMLTRHSLVEEAKHSVRILLVEDNLINQKLALFLLTRAGYQVKVANNGKEALDTFIANPDDFDLIFMDIRMPEMDGITATQEIRKFEAQQQKDEKIQKPVPIIALTAQTMKGDREKFLEAGMDDFISKPIKRETVFEKVKKWAMDKDSSSS